MSLAASVLFCLLFPVTRARASGAMMLLAAGLMISLSLTPFGEVISNRLSTFGNAQNDDSSQERLAEFDTLWSQPSSGLVGIGYTSGDIRMAGVTPTDGMIATCWESMGIAAGLLCIASLIYMIFRAVAAAARSGALEGIVLGALACGWFVQLPLAGIAFGELGFLFWTTMTLAISVPGASAEP